MNTSAPKLLLLVSALAVASFVTAPMVRAADEKVDPKAEKAAAKKAKTDAEVLRKYDKNGNGVLDPDEQAARQANEDKMRALREKKKQKAEAKRAESAPAAPSQQM